MVALSMAVTEEPAQVKDVGSSTPAEENESTDISSSEDGILAAPAPRRRWSDLIDARMLAQDSDIEEDAMEAMSPLSQQIAMTPTSPKRRPRRKGRQRRACPTSAPTATYRSRTSGLSVPTLQNDCMVSMQSEPCKPSQFTGLATFCHAGMSYAPQYNNDNTCYTSYGYEGNGITSAAQERRNVVTWTDILGQDLSLSAKEEFQPAAPCTVNLTWSQALPWTAPGDAGQRPAYQQPIQQPITQWNPPTWEAEAHSSEEVARANRLTSCLQASGLTSCETVASPHEWQAVAY